MDAAWVKIIKVTGAVGVIGLLFSLIINNLFNSEIIKLLGSESVFFLLTMIVCGLIIGLTIAVMKSSNKTTPSTTAPTTTPSKIIDVSYNHGTTHNGDNNF